MVRRKVVVTPPPRYQWFKAVNQADQAKVTVSKSNWVVVVGCGLGTTSTVGAGGDIARFSVLDQDGSTVDADVTNAMKVDLGAATDITGHWGLPRRMLIPPGGSFQVNGPGGTLWSAQFIQANPTPDGKDSLENALAIL